MKLRCEIERELSMDAREKQSRFLKGRQSVKNCGVYKGIRCQIIFVKR